jgi:DNA-binding transcriptional ArsR family regulator
MLGEARSGTVRRRPKDAGGSVDTMDLGTTRPDETAAESGRAGSNEVDLVPIARLVADPTRAAILNALLAGRALAAGELARLARVSAATASEHLARLLDGGLVRVTAQGRHRYYRLAGAEVAAALEALAYISPPREIRSLRQSRTARTLGFARTCYDHLAGVAGVTVHAAMLNHAWLRAGVDGYEITPAGEHAFTGLGVDLAALRARRRGLARPCLDWTERRPHLAGALGAAVTAELLARAWFVRRGSGERGLILTPDGATGIEAVFGCRLGTWA